VSQWLLIFLGCASSLRSLKRRGKRGPQLQQAPFNTLVDTFSRSKPAVGHSAKLLGSRGRAPRSASMCSWHRRCAMVRWFTTEAQKPVQWMADLVPTIQAFARPVAVGGTMHQAARPRRETRLEHQ